MRQAAEDRFWSKVDKSGECWEWTAARSNGYGRFRVGGRVGGKLWLAHQFAWSLSHDPCSELDHICRNPGCVNPDHLRPCTHTENMWNTTAYANSTSGVKGVMWFKALGKWHAQIRSNGVRLHLGYFDRMEDAESAYNKADTARMEVARCSR